MEPFGFVTGIADARSLPGHSKRSADAVFATRSESDCDGGPLQVPVAESGSLRRGAHDLADPVPGRQGVFGKPSMAVAYARSVELEPTCQAAELSAGPEGQYVESPGLTAENRVTFALPDLRGAANSSEAVVEDRRACAPDVVVSAAACEHAGRSGDPHEPIGHGTYRGAGEDLQRGAAVVSSVVATAWRHATEVDAGYLPEGDASARRVQQEVQDGIAPGRSSADACCSVLRGYDGRDSSMFYQILGFDGPSCVDHRD